MGIIHEATEYHSQMVSTPALDSYILEVPGSKPDWGFCGFPQSIQENSKTDLK
jgi:hypothetical protein